MICGLAAAIVGVATLVVSRCPRHSPRGSAVSSRSTASGLATSWRLQPAAEPARDAFLAVEHPSRVRLQNMPATLPCSVSCSRRGSRLVSRYTITAAVVTIFSSLLTCVVTVGGTVAQQVGQRALLQQQTSLLEQQRLDYEQRFARLVNAWTDSDGELVYYHLENRATQRVTDIQVFVGVDAGNYAYYPLPDVPPCTMVAFTQRVEERWLAYIVVDRITFAIAGELWELTPAGPIVATTVGYSVESNLRPSLLTPAYDVERDVLACGP